MPDEQEGFVRRWSRLKREAPAAPVVVPEPVPMLVEEPVEIPPPAETIALEDIGPWLAKKLPEGWRETVLRRVWSADPSIRDFAGLADYAWDWNTPGGAPGWGPLRAADDMAKLLARAIGEPLPAAEPPPEPVVAPAMSEPALDEAPPAGEVVLAAEVEEAQPAEDMALPMRRRGGRATPV